MGVEGRRSKKERKKGKGIFPPQSQNRSPLGAQKLTYALRTDSVQFHHACAVEGESIQPIIKDTAHDN